MDYHIKKINYFLTIFIFAIEFSEEMCYNIEVFVFLGLAIIWR